MGGMGFEDEVRNVSGDSGMNIGEFVANEPGVARVNIPFGDSGVEQAGFGFAAGAIVGGEVGAVVGGGDVDVVCFEFGMDPLCECLELGVGIVAAADAGLVGDDDEAIALSLGMGEEIENAWHELKGINGMGIAVIDIDNAVSV